MNKDFVTRAYNDITLCTLTGTITKESKEIKLKKEGEYFSLLPSDLKIFFPRKLKALTIDEKHFLTLEYVGYPNLGHLMLNKEMNNIMWKNIGVNISYILSCFAEEKQYTKNAKDHRRAMFITKTEREYKNLINNFETFKQLSKREKITINGKEYENFEFLWSKAKGKILELCNDTLFNVVHGDLCFSNILCDPTSGVIRLIDPRGSFGVDGIYGDGVYDAAKLLHSVEGKYELIIYDRYELDYDIDSGAVNYTFQDHLDLSFIKKDILKKFDENTVRLIMSTIFIGMCARHYDSLKRQIIMYTTGIKAMTEALQCM